MREREGMRVDPAQLPDKLMEPAMQPGQPPPSRSPDAADLALAKIAVPWMGFHGGEPKVAADLADIRSHDELAQALAAWLATRGIY